MTSTPKSHTSYFGFSTTRVRPPPVVILIGAHRRRPIAALGTQKSGSSPSRLGAPSSPPAAPQPTSRTAIVIRQPTGLKSGFWTWIRLLPLTLQPHEPSNLASVSYR